MTDKEFQEAINLLLKENKEGLRRIYEAYIKFIYAVVFDTVGSREDAEDITSEFFIKLIRVAGQYKKGMPHRAWLATIAKNMAIDAIRKKQKEVVASAFSSEDEENSEYLDKKANESVITSVSPVEEQATLAQDMREAMKQLNDKEREIIDLKLLGQMKFKDIARMTRQPIGTVTWIYNQGIKKLRRCLANYEQQ